MRIIGMDIRECSAKVSNRLKAAADFPLSKPLQPEASPAVVRAEGQDGEAFADAGLQGISLFCGLRVPKTLRRWRPPARPLTESEIADGHRAAGGCWIHI
jgi:hypothetical protein